ncbi:unnamed protein product [Owenia fusiformis]|uniref:Uncharacterized protein n=1 Tax=Owenia fusiformis TaxID=6347 RepID=A0A8J1XVE5_OWEFU|nr:unnamed protein product [Owenia fusiformis]
MNSSLELSSNLSTGDPTVNFLQQDWDNIAVVVFYIVISISSIGILCNILALAVFLREKDRSSRICLLGWLAVADILFLTMQITYVMWDTPNDGVSMTLVSVVFVPTLFQWTQTFDFWMVVLVTVDRYIYVIKPLRAPQILSVFRAKVLVAMVMVSSILFNVPLLYFEACGYVVYDVEWTDSATIDIIKRFCGNIRSEHMINYAMVSTVAMVTPVAITFTLNMFIIRSVRTSIRIHTGAMSRNERHELYFTLQIIAILSLFVLCGVIYSIILILNIHNTMHKQGITFLVFTSSNYAIHIILAFNSALNFLFYCFIGPLFRQSLLKMLRQMLGRLSSGICLTKLRSVTVTMEDHETFV